MVWGKHLDSQQQAWDESPQPTVQGEFQAIFSIVKAGKWIDSSLWRGQSFLWGHHPKKPRTQPCDFLCSRQQQGQGTFSLSPPTPAPDRGQQGQGTFRLNTSRTRGFRSSELHRLGLSFPGWEQSSRAAPKQQICCCVLTHPKALTHPTVPRSRKFTELQNRSPQPRSRHPWEMSGPYPAP